MTDWAQIQSNALSGQRLTALTDISAVLILSLSWAYRPRFRWDVGGIAPDDNQWNEIEYAISRMENEIMKGLIGAIIPHVLQDIGAFEALNCDGSTYLRVDYPELYEAIDPMLIIDADSFKVPDMRGAFPMGEGGSHLVGEMGGEETHILTVAEMPIHDHTTTPHNHTDGASAPVVVTVGAGAPVPSAVPSAGITSFETVIVGASGGDAAHNNLPPYFTVKWLIIAK